MDRFIDLSPVVPENTLMYLKSNMDRFIVQECLMWDLWVIDLKSNMDRFIDVMQDFADIYGEI